MKRWFRILAISEVLPIFMLCFGLYACRSQPDASKPTIVFTQVPPEKSGVPERILAGRVTGAQAGQRLVLYARNEGRWGREPYEGEGFTKIGVKGHWAGPTALASYYAALLVDPGYSPPELTESLPPVGSGVVASTIVDDRGIPTAALPQPKTINFSGYEWAISNDFIYRAGSRSYFDPTNVSVDANGALHLRISGTPSQWSAAEVKLTRSLGYGTYRFQVRDISHLEPASVLTLVSWDGVGAEINRHELDVELSRWGFSNNDNAHYVVQPYYVPANIVRFRVPAGVFTHSFHWEPGQVTFQTAAGSGGPGVPLLNQHVFTSGVPVAGNESVRMSFFVFHWTQVPFKDGDEVVIEKFEYLP